MRAARAAPHGNALSELAPGMLTIGHGKFGIRHRHTVAGRVRGLQPIPVYRADPILAAPGG